MRTPGDAQAWLVETSLAVTRSPAAWVDKVIADIGPDRIRSIAITPHESGAVELGGGLKPGDSLNILDLPDNLEIARPGDLATTGKSFEGMRHAQALPVAEAPDDLTSETLVRMTTWDGLVVESSIKAQPGTPTEKYWATFKASFDESARWQPEEPAETAEGEDPAPPADLPEIASVEEVREEAGDLSEKLDGWIYEVPSWKAKALRKSLEDLTKTKEMRVAARHILIGYEGASRSEVKDRTREEAEQLANEIRADVLADPSSFSEVAKEKSDGPSGPSGGDLGQFGPGEMAKPFEDATYALDVNGISEVVETEFGFHIIQRLK